MSGVGEAPCDKTRGMIEGFWELLEECEIDEGEEVGVVLKVESVWNQSRRRCRVCGRTGVGGKAVANDRAECTNGGRTVELARISCPSKSMSCRAVTGPWDSKLCFGDAKFLSSLKSCRWLTVPPSICLLVPSMHLPVY